VAIKEYKRIFLDLLFPIYCLGCKKEENYLCDNCRQTLKINEIYFCPLCGIEQSNARACLTCEQKSFLDGLLVATDFKQPIVNQAIHLLKYNFVTELVEIFEEPLKKYLQKNKDWNSDFLLLPVPLHPKRLRERGFNQAELICTLIKKISGNELAQPLLQKIQYTKPQAKVSQAQNRWANISGSFAYNNLELTIEKINIILVDDVCTTGATLQECAKILKNNGWKNVWGLTLARG